MEGNRGKRADFSSPSCLRENRLSRIKKEPNRDLSPVYVYVSIRRNVEWKTEGEKKKKKKKERRRGGRG